MVLLERLMSSGLSYMCRVSSTAKHFLALHTMVERNYSHALILEDDACITLDPDEYPSAPKCKSSVTPADFRDSLPQRLQQLPENFDMLFVGTCSEDTYMKVVREHRRYKGLVAARYSRCVSGMVVSLSGAKKLLTTLPMRHPFDIHINAIATASLRKRNGMDKLRLFWTVPPMMAQTDEVCAREPTSMQLLSKYCTLIDFGTLAFRGDLQTSSRERPRCLTRNRKIDKAIGWAVCLIRPSKGIEATDIEHGQKSLT